VHSDGLDGGLIGQGVEGFGSEVVVAVAVEDGGEERGEEGCYLVTGRLGQIGPINWIDLVALKIVAGDLVDPKGG
jgi:hypothetical protein